MFELQCLPRLREILPSVVIRTVHMRVAGMGESDVANNRTTLIKAIVSMAESLGLELVAEGIEEESQRRRLRALGCTYGQGFHLGRPVPAESMDELVNEASFLRTAATSV